METNIAEFQELKERVFDRYRECHDLGLAIDIDLSRVSSANRTRLLNDPYLTARIVVFDFEFKSNMIRKALHA